MMSMTLLEKRFEGQEAWIRAAVEKVKGLAMATEDALVIGLAGGSTPKPVYEALNKEDLHWERLHFVSIDERYVPVEDSSNNLSMIKSAMPNARVHGFDTSLPIEQSAEEMHMMMYGMDFDLIILGVGADGHIASIFPGSKAVDSTDYATYLSVEGLDVAARLTLTFESLCSAKEAVLLIHGTDKETVIEKVKAGIDLPVTKFVELVPTEVYIY